MSTAIPKSLRVYLERAKKKNTVWTKNEITAMAKAIRRIRFDNTKHKEARRELLWALNQESTKGYSITHEQSEFGITWLRHALYNSKGQLRNSKMAKQLEYMKDAVDSFKSFRFMGYHVVYDNYNGAQIRDLVPVYKIIGRKCAFEYAPFMGGVISQCDIEQGVY